MGVAFVLSGGASLGAMQVGMLRALIERDIRPDVIIGTSVGAVNGAFIASHGPTAGSLDELGDLWRGARRGDVFPLEPLTGLLGFLGVRRNLIPGAALKRLVARNLLHARLEDLPIALHVVACDVLTGAEVLLSHGPLVDAILASAAIPGVLPPVDWDGRLLTDGGIVNNTPISHAISLGAQQIYVLPTGGPCVLTAPPRGALGMLMHATELMVAQRFTGEVAFFRGHAEVIVLPPPCPIDVQPLDFGHAEALMSRAESNAHAFLAGRDDGVVPLHANRRGRRGRRTRSSARVELPPAS
ncbi:MAG: patatin-like phospholipase family protein [Solirubrobacteraceae bacterium]